MSIQLYDEKSKEDIEKGISNIVNESVKKRLELLEPTLAERLNVMKNIKEYIREKRRKIYGGWALNTLIKQKNPKDAFYTELSTPDIEFYSPFPLEDLHNICNILYKKEFKVVNGREAQHKETYTVFCNYEKYCDISYVPQNVYARIPSTIIDKLEIVEPSWLIIDVYRAYTDPLTSYWRLDKTLARAYLLQKYYPLQEVKPVNIINKIVGSSRVEDHPKGHEALEYIYDWLINKDSCVIIGDYAYQYLTEENLDIKKISNFEFISTNFRNDCYELATKIREKFKQHITTKEFYGFFQFTGHVFCIYYDDKLIAKIYHHNKKCTPYQIVNIPVNSDKKIKAYSFENKLVKKKRRSAEIVSDVEEKKYNKLKLGTYALVLLYFFINVQYNRVNKEKEEAQKYRYMIYNLVKCRNTYLKKYNKSILDDSPFREFTVACTGETLDPPREFRLDIERKKREGKPYLYSYDPSSQHNMDPSNFRFNNTSGNLVRKSKNLKIKIEGVDSMESSN
jgi:hypothetical protein